MNFGAFLTHWVRLFGTIYHGIHEDLATGVKNANVPLPISRKPPVRFADTGRQLWFPFRPLLKL